MATSATLVLLASSVVGRAAMGTPLAALKRKVSHRSKVKERRLFHITVLSATGMSRSIEKAMFVIARSDHEFESSVAVQEMGSFLFNERVSQLVTLYRGHEDAGYEAKEYKLVLHHAMPSSKGDKRGPAFAGGKVDLARFAHQKSGKRVTLVLDPASDAKGERKPVTVVLTIAAESEGGDQGAGEDGLRAQHPSASDLADDPFDDEDDDDDTGNGSAHRHSDNSHTRNGKNAPSQPQLRSEGDSDDETDGDDAPTPHKVSSARGAPNSKPLPAPAPPMQVAPVKAVQWGDNDSGALRETRRLLLACCPCLVQTDEFDRQLQ